MSSLSTIALVLSGANQPAVDFVDNNVRNPKFRSNSSQAMAPFTTDCDEEFSVFGVTMPLAAVTSSQPETLDVGEESKLQETAADPTPPVTNGFEIALPTLQDGRYLGDLSVRVAGDEISFDAERFITLLRPDFTTEALSEIASTAVDGRLIVGQFAIDGIEVSYNRQLQQIEIISANSAREIKVLQTGYQSDALQLQLEEPSNFSFFVTPTVTGEYVWEDGRGLNDGFQPVQGTVDIGGRIGGEKGIAFLSRHSFQSGTNGGISREETQVIYDILPRVLRITAGDLNPRGASFQSIPSIGGISVERFFELEPSRLFRPVGQSTFELERPSTVEVRINGVVQREIFLQPGRYDIKDLPLIQGSNLVDLVIRDDTGRERIVSDRNFFDFDLLEAGITDFSLAVGVKSNFGNRAPNYSDDPIVSGFARRGLSSTLTAGVDIQADTDGANGGISVLWASPIGVWRLEASGSQRKSYGNGFAGELGYKTTGRFGDGWRWTAEASGQYFSTDFATVSDSPRLNNNPANPVIGPVLTNQPTAAIFNASFQMTGPRWSFNAAGSYSRGRGNRSNTSSLIAGATYALTPSWSAGAFGRRTNNGLQKDTGIIFQLTWRPSRNSDIRARYDTSSKESELRYRKSASRSVGSLSYGINALRNAETDTLNISGDAFYVGNRFEANARHDVNTDASFGGQRVQNTRLTVGTSLVFAGGKLAIGRPVRDSFAIISPHKSIANKAVRVDPSESGYSAKTDFLGPAVSVDVSPYSRKSLYVDVADLPPGYDLGAGQFAVRPPLFGGYNLTIGSGASYTVIGNISDTEGKPLVYLGGRLESLDNPEAKPIPAFTNRKGRLAATGIKPGRYKLTLFTSSPFTMEIVISEDGPNLLDIGQIEVPTP